MQNLINQAIDSYIKDKPTKERQIGKYYASELGMCPRKLFYIYKYPKQISDKTLRVFQVGDLFHDWVAKMLANSSSFGIKLESNERSISLVIPDKEFIISGRLDDLIVLEQTNERIVLDVKTTKSLDFIDKPKKEHLIQVMMYLKALSINKGGLLYIKKDDLTIKYFEFEFDPLIFKELVDKAELVHNSLVSNTVPGKLEVKDRWACSYCDYSLECLEEGKTEERDTIWPTI